MTSRETGPGYEDRGELSFAGCDYLGFARDPRVLEAARVALAERPLSAGASRVTSGTFPEHAELELQLASWLGAEACALTADGYLANLALFQALRGAVELARLADDCHASLVDAAERLETPLVQLETASLGMTCAPRALLATDSCRPSTGLVADLNSVLASAPQDALLVVDDSHGLGVLGPGGRGALAAAGLSDHERVCVTGSLAKGLGVAGGFVAGPHEHIAAVRASPAYVTATPVPPAWACAALAGLTILRTDPRRHERLLARTRELHALREYLCPLGPESPLPVLSHCPDAPERGAALAELLAQDGIYVPLLEYPGEPCQLRFSVSAGHGPEDLERLEQSLLRARRQGLA